MLTAEAKPTQDSLKQGDLDPWDQNDSLVSTSVEHQAVDNRLELSPETTDALHEREQELPSTSVVADLVSLSKPRIVVMILVTTVATALIGATERISTLDWFILLIGTAGIAASAGAANQIWERRIDLQMPRTATRPLPAKRMALPLAMAFTIVTGMAGCVLLAWQFGWIPALVGAATWAIYVLVYTPLKVVTAWNTSVGAIAGALPVLIGYTATGGGWNDLVGWMLFGILAAWQYPHFMAIAWLYRRQYDEAGFKMTTTVEPTGRSAAVQSIAGSIVIMACGAWLSLNAGFDLGGWLATVLVAALAWPLLKASLRFQKSPTDQTARTMLRSSLLVLPAVLLVVTFRVLW